MRYVVAYDVGSDAARAKVAARLSAWGDRIQKSVFECDLDGEALAELLPTLEELLNLDRDVLQVFRQCRDCAEARADLGQAHEIADTPYWIV